MVEFHVPPFFGADDIRRTRLGCDRLVGEVGIFIVPTDPIVADRATAVMDQGKAGAYKVQRYRRTVEPFMILAFMGMS
jgi:hypothetical protein